MAQTVLAYDLNGTGDGYIVTGITSISDKGEVIIPEKWKIGDVEKPVVRIKQDAFYGSSSVPAKHIKSIEIPKTMEFLESSAINNCDSLERVIIHGLTNYGDYVFNNCPKLKYVIFSPSVSLRNGDNRIFHDTAPEKVYVCYKPDLTPTFSSPMASSNPVSITVKTYYPQSDTDFLGFTFNGKHSYLDLGVLRTISDRMQHSLSPEMNDITADNPGGDGTYYFGSRHKSRKFSIEFAFDHLTEQQMREWKKFCSNKELSDLIFDEEPYKVYTAKITGSPVLKTIAFDENGQRIYKGEGTLEFTCYWPYARTPDATTKISTHFISDGKFFDDGKELMNYLQVLYPTKSQWASASGIGVHAPGDNPGDIPAPFVLKIPNVAGKVAYETRTLKVGTLEVVIKAASKSLDAADASAPFTHYEGVEWDSKTGIVSALISSVRKPIAYTGSSLGAIPVTSTAVSWGVKNGDSALTWTGCSLNYHYWYY